MTASSPISSQLRGFGTIIAEPLQTSIVTMIYSLRSYRYGKKVLSSSTPVARQLTKNMPTSVYVNPNSYPWTPQCHARQVSQGPGAWQHDRRANERANERADAINEKCFPGNVLSCWTLQMESSFNLALCWLEVYVVYVPSYCLQDSSKNN